MNKFSVIFKLSFINTIFFYLPVLANNSPVDYGNTLVGTQSKFELSTGNTYPAIAMPWGMNFWTPQTGDMGPEFSKTIDLETAGGVIDRDTIKWWLKQSREAQSAIMTDEIPLDDALLQLREFIDENSGEFFVQVWGNGANFDNTILRRSYERQGIPCPWRYYNDRDVRTIVELGKAIDFDARTAIQFEGERHNALDDARYQAKYASVIWQKLIPSQADS